MFCQTKLVDHVKKAYSVGDLSAANLLYLFCHTLYTLFCSGHFFVTACVFCQCQAKLVDHVQKSYSVGDLSAANSLIKYQTLYRMVSFLWCPVYTVLFCTPYIFILWQGQAKLVDHVKKSYSVGDLSATNSADFNNTRDERDNNESDDEIDNRLLAEQYNRDIAEMDAAAAFESFQRPATHRGM